MMKNISRLACATGLMFGACTQPDPTPTLVVPQRDDGSFQFAMLLVGAEADTVCARVPGFHIDCTDDFQLLDVPVTAGVMNYTHSVIFTWSGAMLDAATPHIDVEGYTIKQGRRSAVADVRIRLAFGSDAPAQPLPLGVHDE